MMIIFWAFCEILEYAKKNMNPRDSIGIKINVVNDNGINPVGLGFSESSEISADMLTDLIYSVSQSNSQFSVTDNLEISVTVITPPGGGARVGIKMKSDIEILKRKKLSIIDPGRCDDYMCLPKALILGKLYSDGDVNGINRMIYNKPQLKSAAKNLAK